ncbi:MAG: TIGR04282 family arsenosugar biosynthesis glycosyltransferase [Burkholderiales bacterium]|nr:TIGR04282 family arsenosugar biosynthesis glycosyltransferase [Burkholderiales bacterium]
MSYTRTTTALIIFAKAPVAGSAKTRLIPALGAQGAAALAQRLLDHAVCIGMEAGFDYCELCTTPDHSHATFQRLAAGYPLVITAQGAGDLGERMHRALSRVLADHARVLLVGTDVPALTPAVLREAAAALDTCDAVFVPALDGGYALVGLTGAHAELFTEMPWSTPQVMQATRARARAAQIAWTELAPVADIDEPADLVHLPEGWLA